MAIEIDGPQHVVGEAPNMPIDFKLSKGSELARAHYHQVALNLGFVPVFASNKRNPAGAIETTEDIDPDTEEWILIGIKINHLMVARRILNYLSAMLR
jgi:hypothetical protein